LKRLHEVAGARARDGAKVVNQIRLCHADTSITKGNNVVLLVGNDLDLKLLLRVQNALVLERLIADFVQRIGSVGNQLTQENLLVRVESVHDQAHELVDLSLEGELLWDFFLLLFSHSYNAR